MSKILLDRQHLVSFKSGLDRKKEKDYTRGNKPVFPEEKRRWHSSSFQWLNTFHFHIASLQIESLSSFSFCISLSSKQTLKAKMLEFYFPRMIPSKVSLTLPTLKLLSKAAIGESALNSNGGTGWLFFFSRK